MAENDIWAEAASQLKAEQDSGAQAPDAAEGGDIVSRLKSYMTKEPKPGERSLFGEPEVLAPVAKGIRAAGRFMLPGSNSEAAIMALLSGVGGIGVEGARSVAARLGLQAADAPFLQSLTKAAYNPIASAFQTLGKASGISRAITAPVKQEAAATAAKTIPGQVISPTESALIPQLEKQVAEAPGRFVMPETMKVTQDIMTQPGVGAFLQSQQGTVVAEKLQKILAPEIKGVQHIIELSPKDARGIMGALNELDRSTKNVITGAKVDMLKKAVMDDLSQASPEVFNTMKGMFGLEIKKAAARNLGRLIDVGTAEKAVPGLGKAEFVAGFPPKLREAIFKEFDSGRLARYAQAFPQEADKIKTFVDELAKTPRLWQVQAGTFSPFETRHLVQLAGALFGYSRGGIEGALIGGGVATLPHVLNETLAHIAVTQGGRATVRRLLAAGPMTNKAIPVLANTVMRTLNFKDEIPNE